jgi:serine/threonine-protein kinase SIK2
VSLSGKSPCSFLRNNPIGHPTCRATRSPVDFRQGRRASDGLVAQGILNQVDNSINSVAFNSQRLHEACKAKGVLELHLLQQEAASLSSQYQSSVPQEELNVRQREHIYYRNDHNAMLYQCGYKNEDVCNFNKTVSTITSDISNYVGMLKNDFVKHENGDINGMKLMSMNMKGDTVQSPQQSQKPPLQQQLMQHRLLQQKRHILQKQGAMETSLSRRHSQMLRQQSYKIAQSQQILPPLPFPLSEKESEDLLAFQQIVENPNASSCTSPHFLKTTHLHSSQISPSISPQPTIIPEPIWNNLPNNLQASCQISEVSATHEIFHQPLYHQVLRE